LGTAINTLAFSRLFDGVLLKRGVQGFCCIMAYFLCLKISRNLVDVSVVTAVISRIVSMVSVQVSSWWAPSGLTVLCFILSVVFCNPLRAQAEGPPTIRPDSLTLNRAGPAGEIDHLILVEPYAALSSSGVPGEGEVARAILRGTFRPLKPAELYFNGDLVDVSDGGHFEVSVLIAGRETKIEFKSKPEKDEAKTEKMTLSYTDPEEFTNVSGALAETRVKKTFISVGVGTTRYVYNQTTLPEFSSWLLTAKANYNYHLYPTNWDVSLSGFFSLVPLDQSLIVARTLGLNLRIGYTLESVKAPWRLTLLTGAYYTTMFVTNDLFGFKNLSGPQFYPVLRRKLSSKDELYAYAKFAPVSASFIGTDLTNREVAGGLGWVHSEDKLLPITLSVDASSLHMALPRVAIDATSLSLSLAVSI